MCDEYKGESTCVLRPIRPDAPAVVTWPSVTQTLVFEHFASGGNY